MGTEKEATVTYWSKRLDHTLSHTHVVMQTGYAVNAGVLTALGFIWNREQESLASPGPITIGLVALMLLINLMQAWVIEIQRRWYKAIDERARQLLKELQVDIAKTTLLPGAHGVYVFVQLTLVAAAGAFLVSAIVSR